MGLTDSRWYWFLAALRVAASMYALAMIHPDEFFQSQEVMARHVLTDAAVQQLHLPWEFSLPTPNRSVLFPYVHGDGDSGYLLAHLSVYSALVAGLPYLLLQALGLPLSGYVLLLVPRLLLCLASFLVGTSTHWHWSPTLHYSTHTARVVRIDVFRLDPVQMHGRTRW
jgi:hypothetical protein